MGFRVGVCSEASQKDFDRVSKEPGGRLAYLRRFPEALLWIENPSLLEQSVALGLITEHGISSNLSASRARFNILSLIKVDDEVILHLMRCSKEDIPNLGQYSDKIICKAIESVPHRLQHVKSPSERVLMVYASNRWIDMSLILKHDPSPKVLMRAIMSDGSRISYIKNPSHELMMKAVRKNGDNLRYISNPPEDIIRMAVSKCGMAIAHVKNPSEELQRLAVSKSAQAITVIDNPIPELQIAAVEKSPNIIRQIKNPDEDAMWKALQHKPKLIAQIKNATPEMESFAQIVS